GLERTDLERRPIGELRLLLHRKGRAELPVSVVAGRQLELVFRLGDRAHSSARRRVPEPAADVALDRLGHEALLADLLEQDLTRHLALAEAGNLRALREIGGGVLDRVMHVVRRHLDRQTNAVLGKFLDLRLHPAIQADPFWAGSCCLCPPIGCFAPFSGRSGASATEGGGPCGDWMDVVSDARAPRDLAYRGARLRLPRSSRPRASAP